MTRFDDDDPDAMSPAEAPRPDVLTSPPFMGDSVPTHGGLGTVDPWAPPPRPLHSVLWPWGLAGVAETLEVIALALIMFVAVRSVAHNYRVEGSSMAPTFHDGELLIVNRLAYRALDLGWVPGVEDGEWRPFGEPQQGDVIVFIAQSTPRERDFIKRVVGLPGQTVEVRDGTVYVDGIGYEEDYIEAPPDYTYDPVAVPADSLFVLGDNRNNSLDSHIIGMVERSSVLGRVDLRYWPVEAIDVIQRQFGTPAGVREASLSP
ncbi:MAG: signal peptidase I [Dehalococcoidia bacterium]